MPTIKPSELTLDTRADVPGMILNSQVDAMFEANEDGVITKKEESVLKRIGDIVIRAYEDLVQQLGKTVDLRDISFDNWWQHKDVQAHLGRNPTHAERMNAEITSALSIIATHVAESAWQTANGESFDVTLNKNSGVRAAANRFGKIEAGLLETLDAFSKKGLKKLRRRKN